VDCFLDASVSKSEDDVEIALVDSDINQKLIDVLLVVG
jgi:hypothetical protein